MESIALSGAEKSKLRGRGQLMDAHVKIGREGVTQTVIAEIRRHFKSQDLVKVRFVGSDRDQRAAFCPELGRTTDSVWVGSVGATALFYQPPREVAAAESPAD